MCTKRERNILCVNPETPFPSSAHKREIISISQKADGDFLWSTERNFEGRFPH